jgi:hypothetical protein
LIYYTDPDIQIMAKEKATGANRGLTPNPQTLGTGAGQWIAASGIMPGLSAVVNRFLFLVLKEHRMSPGPYDLTDSEIKSAFNQIAKNGAENAGKAVGLAAVVALLPATAGIDPSEAKALIAELLRSSHGAGEIHREADRFADAILAAARDVASR